MTFGKSLGPWAVHHASGLRTAHTHHRAPNACPEDEPGSLVVAAERGSSPRIVCCPRGPVTSERTSEEPQAMVPGTLSELRRVDNGRVRKRVWGAKRNCFKPQTGSFLFRFSCPSLEAENVSLCCSTSSGLWLDGSVTVVPGAPRAKEDVRFSVTAHHVR